MPTARQATTPRKTTASVQFNWPAAHGRLRAKGQPRVTNVTDLQGAGNDPDRYPLSPHRHHPILVNRRGTSCGHPLTTADTNDHVAAAAYPDEGTPGRRALTVLDNPDRPAPGHLDRG